MSGCPKCNDSPNVNCHDLKGISTMSHKETERFEEQREEGKQEGLKPIKFIQFMFPDGREKENIIDRPEPIADRAEVLIDNGFSFEIENNNGKIWMSCVNHETEIAFDRVVFNGPQVPIMVDEMINEAFEALQKGTL